MKKCVTNFKRDHEFCISKPSLMALHDLMLKDPDAAMDELAQVLGVIFNGDAAGTDYTKLRTAYIVLSWSRKNGFRSDDTVGFSNVPPEEHREACAAYLEDTAPEEVVGDGNRRAASAGDVTKK